MRLVQFGAGNIGRGFIAPLFAAAGAEVLFVEVAPELLQALKERRSYTVELVGPRRYESVTVRGVSAVDSSDREAVARAVAEADVVATAVGIAALPRIAPALAAGLALRAPDAPPLNILLCENQLHVSRILRDLLEQEWAASSRPVAPFGLVETVVSRTVPVLSAQERARDPLRVVCDDYDRLPVDARAVVGELPSVPGLEPRADFEVLVEQKLFVHNMGHAVAAYLGYLAGKRYLHEAVADAAIGAWTREAMLESAHAVGAKHGLDPEEQAARVKELLLRFANPAMNDPVTRVGRDPLRKLRPNDRLVGAALLALEQGIDPRAIARGIAAALRFDPPDDPAAVTLQTELRERGLDAVLAGRLGLPPEHPLAARVRAFYDDTP